MNTFRIRGGLGDSAVANTNVKLQDNLYLATNSQWLEKQNSSRSSTYGQFRRIRH